MFLRKQIPRENVGEIFDKYYTDMLETIRDEASQYSKSYDFELVAFMHTLTCFYISLLRKKKREQVVAEFNEVFENRFRWYWSWKDGEINPNLIKQKEFYLSVIQEIEPRAEWCMGMTSSQPDIRMYIALGDRLFNPECVKDYENAHVVIRGIDEVHRFNEMMLKVQVLLRDYCREFKQIT